MDKLLIHWTSIQPFFLRLTQKISPFKTHYSHYYSKEKMFIIVLSWSWRLIVLSEFSFPIFTIWIVSWHRIVRIQQEIFLDLFLGQFFNYDEARSYNWLIKWPNNFSFNYWWSENNQPAALQFKYEQLFLELLNFVFVSFIWQGITVNACDYNKLLRTLF